MPRSLLPYLLFVAGALPCTSAAAEFRSFGQQAQAQAPALSFCSPGKFIIYTGECSAAGAAKDSISAKACADVAGVLGQALPALYPNSQVQSYSDLSGDEVFEALMKPNVLGFFFIGRGDTKGAFVTGPEQDKVYPDISACLSSYDLFGGFTSHSRYSPAYSAPPAARGKVLSRTEMIYAGAGASPESWAKFCKPKWSLVYPTRTFAGRMKGDALKLTALLQEEKRKHVLKTLAAICDNCPGHVAAGDELSRLCPPNSDVCRLRKILPGSEEFILKNYCAALAPSPSTAQ